MSGTINKVILIGNVGGEIKIHRFDNNNLIGRLSIATSESYVAKDTGQRVEQTEWHNLVVRNKLAEIFEKHVKKGDKLYIEGKLKTRKWTDQNGQDRYSTEIIVTEFSFLTPKGGSGLSTQEDSNNPNDSFED
ncbi:MAG: single-stranded DNA-binding protein [Weeksellaceae bacterium]|mgnify:CR=1 FL=1|jgi:single-strand DNA-binding protein|nr:single-stranded DNA-binding protein [Weeksellaceae bacterium]